ncbi:MAG: PDZ domain-containing protein [Bryobacterales bacterium]|nr:PDZ domain-containing protein [Bryobacterales bacterium]
MRGGKWRRWAWGSVPLLLIAVAGIPAFGGAPAEATERLLVPRVDVVSQNSGGWQGSCPPAEGNLEFVLSLDPRLIPETETETEFPADAALLARLWWQGNTLNLPGGSSGSYLGIGVADVTPQMATKLGLEEARGVVVTAVAEGSPAQKAGLRVKDVLIAYNGSRLEGRQQLTRMVGETPAERTISLSILRGGASRDVKLTTAAKRMNPDLKALRDGALAGKNLYILPDMPRMVSIYRSPMLGIESEALGAQMAAFFGVNEGVLVREVLPESPAAAAGLKAGDVIVSISGEKVVAPTDITAILRAKSSTRDGLALVIVRNQRKTTLTVAPSGEWTEGRYFPDDRRGDEWSRK